jgi:hypothetical protein
VNRLGAATVACFVVGAGLLLSLDSTIPLAAGVVLLLAFVVCGVFLVASPEALAEEPDENE